MIKDRLKKARLDAGLSWDDIPTLVPALSKPWYIDLEGDDSEFLYTLDLSVAFLLMSCLKITPAELLSGYHVEFKHYGSPHELANAIKQKILNSKCLISEIENEIGWSIMTACKWPQSVMGQPADFLMDICKYVKWNWVNCVCLWFDQWKNGQGRIVTGGPEDSLSIFYLPPLVEKIVLEIIGKHYPGYLEFLPEHPSVICISDKQKGQLCSAISLEIEKMPKSNFYEIQILHEAIGILKS